MREYTFPVCGNEWPVHVPERPEDLEPFRRWVMDHAHETIAVDTEGKGLKILSGDPSYVRLVQFGTETEAWNIPIELGPAFRDAARWALESLSAIVGHNWHGFDALALHAALGLDYDMLCRKATDTMILAKLIDPRSKREGGTGAGLKPLSDHFIDPTAADTQGDLTAVFRSMGLTKATGFERIDLWDPTYQSYAGGDVILTARLLRALRREADRVSVRPALIPYEHEISRICGHMSLTGMLLDHEYNDALSVRLAEDAERNTLLAARYGVEKIGAPKQIAEALLGMGETLILPGNSAPERTAGGQLKVDKAVLSYLASDDRSDSRPANPLARAIIAAKRAAKWRQAYAVRFADNADVNGRVHPNVQTLAARTGRMSVTDPAVQTLPSSDWMIRRSLLADPGHVMISTDFQAVELRVLAALANVSKMKEAIHSGADLHGYTATLVFGPNYTDKQRKICKGVAFGTVYGGGATTIARQTGIDIEPAKRAQDAYHRAYPEIRQAANRWQRDAFDNDMTCVSITGRRLPLDRDRTYAATNYQVQSAARDCLGQALIEMDRRGLTQYLRLPIHDEVVASAPVAEAAEVGREIADCMTFDLMGVPIEAAPDVAGRSWGSLYMKDREGRYLPNVLTAHDPYFAEHPSEAYELAQ